MHPGLRKSLAAQTLTSLAARSVDPVGSNRLLGRSSLFGRSLGSSFFSAGLGAFNSGLFAHGVHAGINRFGFRSGFFGRSFGRLTTASRENERSKGSRKSKLRLHFVVTPNVCTKV